MQGLDPLPVMKKLKQAKFPRLWQVLIALALALLITAGVVWAFAEESLRFRDPYTGETGEAWEEISTIHFDLTYMLALAAGFSVSDSITLQVWNQLVDSEQIGPGEAVSYTNCISGGFRPQPAPRSACGVGNWRLVWPMWENMQDTETCVTSRFGPYSPFFHFPHSSTLELGALHDWGWGLANELTAYEAYAWGKMPLEVTVMQASCRYTRTMTVTTGIQAGSLEAFATYLHSLADFYSHRECIAAMDALDMPWATHTITGVPACNYNPFSPSADDVHGREFYTYTDALRTDEAIRHVYSELVARSTQREGVFFPISLDTPISGTETLSEVLSAFVHNWDFDHPGERRALADRMAGVVLAIRLRAQHNYLPLVIR